MLRCAQHDNLWIFSGHSGGSVFFIFEIFLLRYTVIVMGLPPIFGNTWEEFIANWCLGNPPIEDQQKVENALTALFRIWPEKQAAMANAGIRGLLLVSPAVATGLVLSVCEQLDGFGNVLRRLKDGERSAHTELILAARLVNRGLKPILEPPTSNGSLDTCIPTENGKVYCEVIAPETSDAIREVRTAASALATILRDQNKGRRIEVLLSTDIDERISAEVAQFVRTQPDSNEIFHLDAIALISKRIAGNDLNVGPTIESVEATAIIGAAQFSLDYGVRTTGIVRLPVTDARAKRLLYGESHHFSRAEMNILVMDVTKIVSNLKAWSQMIERCFQPDQNRRFGAVVLFWTGITGDKLETLQKWQVVRNPYAYRPIPESLLQKILTLD